MFSNKIAQVKITVYSNVNNDVNVNVYVNVRSVCSMIENKKHLLYRNKEHLLIGSWIMGSIH